MHFAGQIVRNPWKMCKGSRRVAYGEAMPQKEQEKNAGRNSNWWCEAAWTNSLPEFLHHHHINPNPPQQQVMGKNITSNIKGLNSIDA